MSWLNPFSKFWRNREKFSLLSYTELVEIVEAGYITGVDRCQINGSSIDLSFGSTILFEAPGYGNNPISLRHREPLLTVPYDIRDTPYYISPGEFILAQSSEVFHLPPWLSAEYKLKSSMARIGLEHLNAGWADAGWNGSVLTLELKNMTQRHAIGVQEGDFCGQMIFWRHKPVPEEHCYSTRGRYNGDKTVHGMKP